MICQKCQWVASPHSPIDYSSMKYDCPNCSTRNSVSSQHQNLVTQGYVLPEFEAKNTMIEYLIGEDDSRIPFLIFLIDTCMLENEFNAMKKQIIDKIESLDGFYIGLITFSQHVFLHDLSSPFLRETIINGSK